MSILEIVKPEQSTATTESVSLRDSVKKSVTKLLAHLEGQDVSNLYDLVISEVEEPLLQLIMQYTEQNQSKAAIFMGLSRGTLRKKLERYGMLISGASRKTERE